MALVSRLLFIAMAMFVGACSRDEPPPVRVIVPPPVPSPAIEEVDPDHPTDVQLAWLRGTLRTLQQLEKKGRGASHVFSPECMQRARADWAISDDLKRQLVTKSLTWPGSSDMRTAASLVHGCLACADDFAARCDDTKQALTDAVADFKERGFTP